MIKKFEVNYNKTHLTKSIFECWLMVLGSNQTKY